MINVNRVDFIHLGTLISNYNSVKFIYLGTLIGIDKS